MSSQQQPLNPSPLDATAEAAHLPPDDGARPPLRLAVALPLGVVLWLGPFIAGITVLLPARLETVAPDQKVQVVAALAIAGSIVALVANILFGALSDLTRSRWGRRTPWMILGSVTTSILMYSLTLVDTVAGLVALWCLFQFFLNAIVAPLIAVIPDRVPTRIRGTYSAIYGVGGVIGAGLAGVVASRYVADPTAGLMVFGTAILFAGPLVAVIAPDRSSKDIPRVPFSREMLLRNFSFPRHNSRDFYLALVGKLLFVLAMYTIIGYQLYIFTDHFGLDALAAGAMIATIATIQMVLSLVSGALSGPLSDRLGRRKSPVVASSLLMAVALLVPFVWQQPAAMIVFAVLGLGLAFGTFNSVDQALNYEVLPDPEAAAKDLGILNMANTGGQILGPIVMSVAVTSLGGYRSGFLMAAVIAVLSALVISRVRGVR